MAKEKSLSQKEIDALLSILPTDGEFSPESKRYLGSARTYDFRSPDKFSKEQIRTLQMIHENFSRRVSSSLAAYLRSPVNLSCVHIEQGSFADFLQNISHPSLLAVMRMEPLPGRILLTLDVSISTVTVDRLLGGFGTPANAEHRITDIEQSLLRGFIRYVADGLSDAWRNVIALNVIIEEMTLNPEFVQVALPTDAAIYLGFEFKVREGNGAMGICIPYSVLKPIISKLSPHTWVSGETKESGTYRKTLLSHLNHTQVQLSVLLGEINIDFNEILQLREDDILVLDTAINRSLPILVGENKKYLGQPGLIGANMAVQVTDVLKEIIDE